MEKAKARDKGEGKKPAPSPGPAKSYKDKTLSHGDAKNQCPHCKDDVPARASLHLDRYPSSKCLSRPDGPLQGLTGKDRVNKRRALVKELLDQRSKTHKSKHKKTNVVTTVGSRTQQPYTPPSTMVVVAGGAT